MESMDGTCPPGLGSYQPDLNEGEIERSRSGGRIDFNRFGNEVRKRFVAAGRIEASGPESNENVGRIDGGILLERHHPVSVNRDAAGGVLIPVFLERAAAGSRLGFVTNLLLFETQVLRSQSRDHQHTGQQESLAKS